MTKGQREKWGRNDFVGDKFLMQRVVIIPSNGWEGKSSVMIPSNDLEYLKYNDDGP